MLELRLGARAARAIGGRLRAVAEHLDAGSLRDGSWFERLTAAHLAAHAQKVDSRRWDRRYPGVPIEQRARREVEKASRRAAAAGALAAVLASGGELVTLATDGLAGPVGVPAALLSIGLDAVYQALMQVNLVLDLGVIYEAPFGADEVGAIAALFALALATEPPSSTEGPMAARLAGLDDGAHAARVGRTLLHGSFVRNAVPVIGVALSAGRGRASTATLGATAQRHLRLRRALRAPLAQLLRPGSASDPALLVEGVGLLGTLRGPGDERGLLSAAAVMRSLTPEQRRAVVAGGPPGAEWFEKLGSIDRELHPALLELLYLVVAANGRLASAEGELLRRVGEVLGQEIDLARVERLCAHVARGEDP